MYYNQKDGEVSEWSKVPDSKSGVQQPEPRVQIPPSPPREVHTKQPLGFVSYFYLWDCFGIVINFERPKVENPTHLNWINQQRDEHGQWIKKKND